MQKREERNVYEIESQKYTVITTITKNAESSDKLYEAFSKYVQKKLNSKNGLTIEKDYVIICIIKY